ncbi:MAG: sortase domain-bontaining protein, partial [Catenulispora sp.]
PGAAIVVGHLDSMTGPAAFARLSELRPGDRILISRADRTSVAFVVEASGRFPKDAFPRDLVYGATPTPTLRLLTCGGAFDRNAGHYKDNLVVFAHLAEPATAAAPTTTPPPPPAPVRATPHQPI